MPPKQCPECGRFLSNDFVAELTDAPAACPKCETELTADVFVDDQSSAANGSRPAAAETSVRPPDLAPDDVRDDSADVLAGWDVGVSDDEVASWRRDRRPFPTDTVVVLAAGTAGLVLGVLCGREQRSRSALLGAVAGIVGAGSARQIWRLTP